jgi:hypothetical protein
MHLLRLIARKSDNSEGYVPLTGSAAEDQALACICEQRPGQNITDSLVNKMHGLSARKLQHGRAAVSGTAARSVF